MDELDIKILSALISESAIAQSGVLAHTSLRKIARRLNADDMTVTNRFRKLQSMGCMSRWQIFVNPSFFGYKVMDVEVYVHPESAKDDMIRKIKLVHGVVAMANFYGKGLKIIALYDSDETRSRTIELISRITNAERLTVSRMATPRSETTRLTDTDVAIIKSLSNDARKSPSLVAKEVGVSTRTVRNRVDRLRREKTLSTIPYFNISVIPGLIPVYLSYSYQNREAKDAVDHAMRSHFDPNFLWGGFTDPERGFVVLGLFAIAEVPKILRWARELTGVAGADADIMTDMISMGEKFGEMLAARKLGWAAPRPG